MYNYFIPHKIEVNEILNISKNEENRRLNQNEILNMQIEKLNESMFFKFFKRLEDYKERNISICEEKIRSSRMETERIGLFIWKSDTARCVLIRKEMFQKYGLIPIICNGYDKERDAIFQFYVFEVK